MSTLATILEKQYTIRKKFVARKRDLTLYVFDFDQATACRLYSGHVGFFGQHKHVKCVLVVDQIPQ